MLVLLHDVFIMFMYYWLRYSVRFATFLYVLLQVLVCSEFIITHKASKGSLLVDFSSVHFQLILERKLFAAFSALHYAEVPL